MTEKIKFLHQQFAHIPSEHDVAYSAYPDMGGCCGGGYDVMYPEITLNKAQILKVLKESSEYPEVFDGLELEEVSEEELDTLAKEACYPDTYVSITSLPYELQEIADLYDEEDNTAFMESFNALKDGTRYEFQYNIDGYYENEDINVKLTARQARGLILEELGISLPGNNWVEYSLSDVEDKFDSWELLPDISHGWDDVVTDDEFLSEISCIIDSYMSGEIDEEEVADRFAELDE